MRIAFVCTHASIIGGSYVHVRDVSTYLIKQGHEVKVFVGGTGAFTEQLIERQVPFHSLSHLDRPISPSADMKAMKELQAALEAYKPELISCHSTKAGMVGRIVGKRIKVPTLYTAHGWTFVDGISKVQRIIVRAIERFCRPMGPRIICVCEADKQVALAENIGPASHFTVVHNGMPDAPERAEPGASQNRIVVVARMDLQKDHETLFKALSRIKDIPWDLDLVGDGPKRAEYEQLVVELGIAPQVHFHGSQKNVKPFLQGAALFALVTNYEGFPRSTLEAMRTGLPILVTDVNGCKEAIEEGKSGFSVPVKDDAAVEAKLRIMLSDPELRTRMGQVSRQRYEAEFTFDHMIAETKKVYSEVLGRTID